MPRRDDNEKVMIIGAVTKGIAAYHQGKSEVSSLQSHHADIK